MPKSWNNPTRPDDSPISVTHTGWDQTAYKNYVSEEAPKPKTKIAGRVENFKGPRDYQKSKTEEVQIDKRLDRAIKDDLINRNIQ